MVTNTTGISLPLAVWLLYDDYDYQSMPNYISWTSLMKPVRQIILPKRMLAAQKQVDVSDLVARALGHSLHDSIEKAWKTGYERSLALLGYPDKVIQRVVINPSDAYRKATPDCIPVFLEQRAFREIDGMRIGGKFDMVAEGIVNDNKSTSAWTWRFGGKDDDYRLQMSGYRWIDAAQPMPKITADYGQINFIFTDWSKMHAKTDALYPQKRVEHKQIELYSEAEMTDWVKRKLALLRKLNDVPETLLPECSDEELWRSDPKFKYYADPAKTAGKSTRNFNTLLEANAFMAEKGGKGVVISVPGEPKRCLYCEAFSVCSQKDKYFPS